MDFNFSDDEKHRATLEVLRETLAYLERLPKVPVTRELCASVQMHLDQPTNRLVAGVRREMHGTAITSVGMPVLDASVLDNVLRLKLPEPPEVRPFDRQTAISEVVRQLTSSGGLSIGLKSRNARPSE